MLTNIHPGKLIVIEGLDGSGTTTQADLLNKWLLYEGFNNVWKTQEPTTGPIGALIRTALSGRLLLDAKVLAALFAADRLDHLYKKDGVIDKLKSNSMVIMDRYYMSSWAYQTITMDSQEKQWLKSLHASCIMPDITIYLDVPVDICMERIKNHRRQQVEIFEEKNLLIKIEKQYQNAIEVFRSEGENITILDGTLPPQEIHHDIKILTQETLTKNRS